MGFVGAEGRGLWETKGQRGFEGWNEELWGVVLCDGASGASWRLSWDASCHFFPALLPLPSA